MSFVRSVLDVTKLMGNIIFEVVINQLTVVDICDPSVQNQSHVAKNMYTKRGRWALIWCKKIFSCDN